MQMIRDGKSGTNLNESSILLIRSQIRNYNIFRKEREYYMNNGDSIPLKDDMID